MGLITDIAGAVVLELNAQSFTPPFTAVRHYRPEFDLAQLKTLRVSVVPRSIAIVSLGRSLNQHDVSVDVAVQAKIDAASTDDLDELMGLVEQIAEFFRLRRLTQVPSAVWQRTENSPIYSPEHLERHGVFTSILTLTFRVVR